MNNLIKAINELKKEKNAIDVYKRQAQYTYFCIREIVVTKCQCIFYDFRKMRVGSRFTVSGKCCLLYTSSRKEQGRLLRHPSSYSDFRWQ